MKAKFGWVDQWQTEADDDVTLPKFIAAFAVFVLWLLVAFVYIVALAR